MGPTMGTLMPNLRTLLLSAAFLASLPGSLRAQQTDPLWPCVQRFVPAISPGALWDGPPLDGLDWRGDAEVAALAAAAVEGDAKAAEAKVAAFSAAVPEADRGRRLTLLFAGILDTANARRDTMIAAIRRQAAGVNALADRINDLLGTRGRLIAEGRDEGGPEVKAVDDELYWLQRAFDGKRKAQPYLCEQPVLTEQRVGVLARAILADMP